MTGEQKRECMDFGRMLRAGRGIDPDMKPNSDFDLFMLRLSGWLKNRKIALLALILAFCCGLMLGCAKKADQNPWNNSEMAALGNGKHCWKELDACVKIDYAVMDERIELILDFENTGNRPVKAVIATGAMKSWTSNAKSPERVSFWLTSAPQASAALLSAPGASGLEIEPGSSRKFVSKWTKGETRANEVVLIGLEDAKGATPKKSDRTPVPPQIIVIDFKNQ